MIPLIALAILKAPQTAHSASKKAPSINASTFASYHWRSVGPSNMGGRVSDICFDPSNPKIFFVSFGTGGVWKTTDMGSQFTPIFNNYGTSCIGSVAVEDAPENWSGWKSQPNLTPSEKKKQGEAKIVWVGSGEGNGRNSSSWGDGMYLSTDGGTTFKNVGLKHSYDIPRIAVDPQNPDICYAAALGSLWGYNKTRGVYKTSDAGKTWKPVLQIDDKTGADDILMDPKNPNVLYAAMYSRLRTPYGFSSGSTTGGIFKSTDAGAHWSKLTNGLPGETGRIGLAISPQNPSILVATIESDLGGSSSSLEDDRSNAGGVFRSQDGGKTWHRGSVLDPRAWYFSKLAIDPKNANRVYMVGWDVWRSDDGGKNFVAGFSKGLHTDWHAIAIDPTDPKHIVAGCDGGLFQTEDGCKTWDFLNTMAVGEFYNVAVDSSTPFNIAGGLQDNSCWLGPSATRYQSYGGAGIGHGDWHPINGGDGFHVGFDPTNPNCVYSEAQNGYLVRLNLQTGARRQLMVTNKEGHQTLRFNWNTPFIVSKHEPGALYLGSNRLIKLTNRGDDWHIISPDLTTNDPTKMNAAGSGAENYCTIVSIAESPAKQGVIWTGSDDGRINVTQNDGKSWKNVTPASVNGYYVGDIAAGYSNPGTAYAVVDGHRSNDFNPKLLETRDFGAHWSDITSNLPKGDGIRSITTDPTNPNLLYCGNEIGIYISLDRGMHWIPFNEKSLPTCSIQQIVVEPRTHSLVVATHGRSIYVLDDASALAGLTPKIMKQNLHVFAPKSTMPIRPLRNSGEGVRGYEAEEPKLGAYFDFWSKNAGGVKVKIMNSRGTLIDTLMAGAHPGLNRIYWNMQPNPAHQLQNQGQDPGEVFASPGIYDVEFTEGQTTKSVKFTILKGGISSTALPIPRLIRTHESD